MSFDKILEYPIWPDPGGSKIVHLTLFQTSSHKIYAQFSKHFELGGVKKTHRGKTNQLTKALIYRGGTLGNAFLGMVPCLVVSCLFR